MDSSPPIRLPHFLVVGAMKCGTTTLRHLLRTHPRIYMPAREIFVFAIDDLEQHPGASSDEDGRWRVHDFDASRDAYLRWYSAFFDEADPAQILGESSTTYLPSEKAAKRIAAVIPGARLIFMLRDPVERAYSQYWHLVRSGGATESFERMLRRSPATLIQRSCYQPQIEKYLDRFPKSQLRFVLFEEFIREPHRIASGLAEFVGATGPLPEQAAETPRNVARMPRSVSLQLLRNRWLGPRGARDRFGDLGRPLGDPGSPSAWRGAADWAFGKINPFRGGRPPAMDPLTRRFLIDVMRRENKDLSHLIGIDVDRHWYRERPARGRGAA